MNDNDLKGLFKAIKYPQPSQLEVARWKKIVRQELINKTPSEWMRLAVASLLGFAIGSAVFKSPSQSVEENNFANNATIERIYVNLE